MTAGRQLLGRLRGLVAAGEPFCIETNLAGRSLLRWVEEWHARGYVVRLAFTALDSPELALERVATRVALGGHDVPDDVVRQRWAAGLRLFFDVYVSVVDEWVLFDNSGQSLRRVAGGDSGRSGASNRGPPAMGAVALAGGLNPAQAVLLVSAWRVSTRPAFRSSMAPSRLTHTGRPRRTSRSTSRSMA